MLDRYRGCIYGGAAGDALGVPVELMSSEEIHEEYGPNGITDFVLNNGVAEISDDTQMTLFTANGILAAETVVISDRSRICYSDYIYNAYKDWYLTQIYDYPIETDSKSSWILNVPEMCCKRHPGQTCIETLKYSLRGSMDSPVNNSKGSGGIMRVAPIGLFDFNDISKDLLGAQSAALTHGHELGYIPAAAQVHMIDMIVHKGMDMGCAVSDTIDSVKKIFKDCKYTGYFVNICEKALSLAMSDRDDLECIEEIGEGWVAEETFAIALYCAVKYSDDFEKGICAAVNHGGDSDSTGAVTGSILGAYLGYDRIPDKYKENIEMKSLLDEIALDLYYGSLDDEGLLLSRNWMQKYVYMNYSLK